MTSILLATWIGLGFLLVIAFAVEGESQLAVLQFIYATANAIIFAEGF